MRGVIGAENPAGLAVRHQIALAADHVTHEARPAHVHGFVDRQSPRLGMAAGGQHKEVGEQIARRHLALIGKRQEAHVRLGDLRDARLQDGFLLALAHKHQRGVGARGGKESLQQGAGLLARKELAGKEHDAPLRGETKIGAQAARGLLVGGPARIKMLMVDCMRCEMQPPGRHAEGFEIGAVGGADVGDGGEPAIKGA